MSRPVALTVAGSDSTGGAGIVADAKTFEAHRVWATVALTAVTAQDTLGVRRVQVLDARLVRAQIDTVIGDVDVAACKTGMLGDGRVVAAVADCLAGLRLPLVVDPVMVSSSGTALLDEAGVALVRERLVPLATVVTPNLAEAASLTGRPVADRDAMAAAAAALVGLGCRAALVTGGHLEGGLVADCLVVGRADPVWFVAERLPGPHDHGTGCVLSAAVTAGLALGVEIGQACADGVDFVRGALGAGVRLGRGPGPVDPGWRGAAGSA